MFPHLQNNEPIDLINLNSRRCHQDGSVRGFKLHAPNKDQQLDSYPLTETALGELKNPVKKLQPDSRIKPHKTGRTASSCLHNPLRQFSTKWQLPS